MKSEAEAVSRYLDSDPMHLEHHLHWHRSNPFPWPPNFSIPDPRNPGNPWPGNDLNYGSKFLRMHRHMLEEFDAWRRSNGFKKVVAWNPARRIPSNIQHTGRQNNNPRLPLESWFTKRGGRRSEPATENRKLGDFDNENQLGAVITWWYNAVHGSIGGDMSFASRAPADPVFWRFHKFLDDVYAIWERITDKDQSEDKEEEEPEETLSVSENNKANVSSESPDLTFGGKDFSRAFRQQYVKGRLLGISSPIPPSEAKNKVLLKKSFTPSPTSKNKVLLKKSFTPSPTSKKLAGGVSQPIIFIHFRYVVMPPKHMIVQYENAIRQTYGQYNIGVVIKTRFPFPPSSPAAAMRDIEVSQSGTKCTVPPSNSQNELLKYGRENVEDKDLVVYFVRSVKQGFFGCSTIPPYTSSCFIAENAPFYTVAHEVGHMLGLTYHVTDTNHLMLQDPRQLTNPPPDLKPEEIHRIISRL
jgi:hypothetical protein